MSLVKKLLILTLAFNFAFCHLASACIQENAFVFGASISAGYFKLRDVVTRNGSNKTSIEYLIAKTGKDYSFNNENTIVQGGWYLEQTQEMLANPKTVEQMKSSSVILSMDAFYWDAIDGEAYYSAQNTCEQSIATLNQVVDFATENEIPLVLANIPGEKGTPAIYYVRWISSWAEPFDNCYLEFNAMLKTVCLADNNCFIVDIDDVVTRLNNGTGVEWNGQRYHRDDLRSIHDGVHLTEKGNEYIAFLIEEAVGRTNPELLVCE